MKNFIFTLLIAALALIQTAYGFAGYTPVFQGRSTRQVCTLFSEWIDTPPVARYRCLGVRYAVLRS